MRFHARNLLRRLTRKWRDEPRAAPAPIADGRARLQCAKVCDAQGWHLESAHQGDTVHFRFDFAVDRDLGAASAAVDILDESGRLVHSKESFQCAEGAVVEARAGATLRYDATVELSIECGRYRYGIRLSSADPEHLACYRDGTQSGHEFRRHIREHVRAMDVGSFFVLPRADGRTTHQGLADLRGSQAVAVLATQEPVPAPTVNTAAPPPVARPTIFHVTHWKAGSQWLHAILRECAPDRIVEPQVGDTQFRQWPIQPGMIYATVYVDRKAFDAREQPGPFRRFVVARDLRDTLVSGYFSLKLSHQENDRSISSLRADLERRSFEDGMIFLMDGWLVASARIQLSWQEGGERIVRYEDLLERDLEILEPLLLGECALGLSSEKLRRIVAANRFRGQSGGREPGIEDLHSHQRKGIAGDWRNHFTEPVKRAFKARFGGILVAMGYEHGLDW